MFTFTLGADQTKLTVHSSALAGLSPSLDALMNGEMIEAKTRHVDWSEVDVDTFVRLCEFAYFRNYTPPSSRLFDGMIPIQKETKGDKKKSKRKKHRSIVNWGEAEPEPEPAQAPEEEPVPEFGPAPGEEPVDGYEIPPPENTTYTDPEIAYKERSVWTGHLRDAFASSLIIPSTQTDNLSYTFTPPMNSGSWDDFNPVFLGQARLYILADKYCIESLRHLVLSKLHETLTNFKLYDTGVSGLVEFVRFVYLNTPPNYPSQVDALRNLATRYIVSVLGQIGDHECFRELLEEGGPFVSDFWRIIWDAEGDCNL